LKDTWSKYTVVSFVSSVESTQSVCSTLRHNSPRMRPCLSTKQTIRAGTVGRALFLLLQYFSYASPFAPSKHDISFRSCTTSRHRLASTSDDLPVGIEILSSTSVSKTGGRLLRVKHASSSTKTDMTFAIFLPKVHFIGTSSAPLPALYWLSGLTWYVQYRPVSVVKLCDN